MSFSHKFLIFIIFLISFIKISSKTSIVSLPFKVQKTNLSNIEPKNIVYPTLIDNNIYTEIKVGSNSQTIPLKIEFTSYLFFISGKNTNSVSKFDESQSSTFNKISDEKFYNSKNLLNGYVSSDYIMINNNKINTTFILGTKVENDISGAIGLNIEDSRDTTLNPYNYISELKKNNIINDYYFTIKYNDNENGNLIIGELPHNYDSNYKKENYIDCYTKLETDDFTWKLSLDNIFIAENLDSKEQKKVGGSTYGYFKVERKVMEGTETYRQGILENFFSEKIKNGICFEENTSTYFTYYCKKNVNFNNFTNLYFYNKDLDYNFEFTYKDLFFYNELDENYYFLVVFDNNYEEDGGYLNYLWTFGEPFFKKYQLIFNKDTKRIGLYTNVSNNDNKNNKTGNESWFSRNKWYFLLAILLVILLVALTVTIILYIKKGPRRKAKANELDDDFEYSSSSYKDQTLFSN